MMQNIERLPNIRETTKVRTIAFKSLILLQILEQLHPSRVYFGPPNNISHIPDGLLNVSQSPGPIKMKSGVVKGGRLLIKTT
jgi:hypothetical protein